MRGCHEAHPQLRGGAVNHDALRQTIDAAYERRAELTPERTPQDLRAVVDTAIAQLDSGTLRVAEKRDGRWQVNEWLKKAVLLYFRIQPNQVISGAGTRYYDKIPLKYAAHTQAEFQREGTRIVPPATVRYGAFLAPDVVLMPSYVNIGAYVDRGTMVDTWATIGSCAQIGKNVHISGGAGIGGVLEPLQAAPTIIEDDCFIGARSEIVEGVIVEQGAVISMGVFIGQSTRIYDRESGEITYGRVPAGAVVVPGSLPSSDGRYNLQCAVIVKRVDAKTRAKVGINELLRGIR
ncbi:MAG: 2,3,4,5-tetrahydropyridine-2,6-dicarboxylate N-succinyltransferase [Gammaproteobacteria bacterium]|nr:2,3,4,5-tetrahydropyridine-2,6-dicarboxylate N-succinyltransferase [Gammaproteobacteria bacterium]